MKETEEKIPKAEPDEFEQWESEKATDGKFFKPKSGAKYTLRIKNFEFGKKAFKKGDVPKWTMTVHLLQVNNQPDDREWSTSARAVIEALRPFKNKWDALTKRLWMLERTDKDGKTIVVFSDLTDLVPLGNYQAAPSSTEPTKDGGKNTGGAGVKPASSGNDDVEAFF